MEKKPLIPIDDKPIEVWYESPSVMIVRKPRGIKVHPDNETESGTLLNRLFQDNRWLAGMETSKEAGLLHLFDPEDHGLMLFNKADDYEESLHKAFSENEITFSYIIKVLGAPTMEMPDTIPFNLIIKSKSSGSDFSMIDIETTEGNTRKLRAALFPDLKQENISLFCYQIGLTLPHSGKFHTTSLLDTENGIPHISVYHAPP